MRLTDDHRRRLAAKGQPLGRRVLAQVVTVVTPDTILRWHWRLIAPKMDVRAEAPGPSRNHEEDLGAHPPNGHRESLVGLQSHPGGAEESRPPRREKHGRQGVAGQRDPARPAPAVVVAHLPTRSLGPDRGG